MLYMNPQCQIKTINNGQNRMETKIISNILSFLWFENHTSQYLFNKVPLQSRVFIVTHIVSD